MGEAVDRYEALPGLQRMHDALDPKWGPELRIVNARAGYGSGKTFGGAWEAIRQSRLNPGWPILCVSPSYPQAHDTTFLAICEHLDGMGVDFHPLWSYLHEIRIPAWNGWLKFGTPERAKSIKGPNCAGAWLDEPGIMPQECLDTGELVWDIIIRRVRRGNFRRIWLSGTTEGFNWLYNMLEGLEPFQGKNPYMVADVVFSSRDNFHNAPEYIAGMVASYGVGTAAARQYIDGEFADIRRGQVYGVFSRELHVSDAVAFDPALETCVTFDFNRAPMTALICQVAGGQDLRVVAEIILHAATTADACREVDRWLGEHAKEGSLREGIGVYGDPAGHSQSVRSHTTDYQTILSELARWRPTKHAVTAHSPQTRRVDCVCWRLRENHVQIHSSCRTLTTDLLRVSYLPGSATLDKRDPTLTHASDALGYLIERRWPIGGGGGGFIRG